MCPTFNRQTLRQRLGLDFLRDTIIGNTSGSWGTQAGSYNIIDSSLADPTASGEEMYYRHHLRLLGSAGKLQDTRVGSFNTGSGAFLGAVTLATTVFSGMPFEVHSLVSPTEKDRALDGVIQDLRQQQELPIWAIDNGHVYSLGNDVLDVLDVRYFSNPTDSLNIGEHPLRWFDFETTATGQQLRIDPALPASYQLIIHAILDATLGAADLATVFLRSDEQVLWGAAARCYWLLQQQSPGKESEKYEKLGEKAAREASKLAARFQPNIARRIMLQSRY